MKRYEHNQKVTTDEAIEIIHNMYCNQLEAQAVGFMIGIMICVGMYMYAISVDTWISYNAKIAMLALCSFMEIVALYVLYVHFRYMREK